MAPRIMSRNNPGLRRSIRPTPGWFATPGAFGVTFAVLVAAVTLGVQLPGFGLLGGVGEEALDYSPAGRGRFQPLSDTYLSRVLGVPVLGGSAADSLEPPDAGPRRSSTRSSRERATPDRVVTHGFTNDDFESAYEVSSLPFRAQTNIAEATRQPDEPADCFPAGGTAWYRYRAPARTALFADTFGSTGPTSLGIYTGESLGQLHKLGCDTNVLGNAQVGFSTLKEATYWFQVTSVKGGATVFGLAAVGATTVQTVSPSGGRPDGPVHPRLNRSDISGDGRWLVFVSNARNLTATPVDCGWPQCGSLYLRDRMTGTTTVVATGLGVSESPGPAGAYGHPASSPDGRYLGFSHIDVPGTSGIGDAADAVGPAIHAYLFDGVVGRFEIVSRNSAGEVARPEPGRNSSTVPGHMPWAVGGSSGAPSISSDGRYVTFYSDGANLGGHVEYGRAFNVYRRDRATGTTRLVSVDAEGRPMRANSFACTGRNISGDGRYVFFASTFGTGQDNPHSITHLYLWDATTGRTRQITRLPDGVQTLGSYCPSISLDGSRTAFVARDALVPEDTNGTPDVYAYEVATGRLQRVSVTSAGKQTIDANYAHTEGSNLLPRSVTLSADGRYVAFDSSAPDLVPSWVGSTRRTEPGVPGPIQVYVHDISTRATVLASVSSTGEPLAGNSVVPYISPDGKTVSFLNSGLWTDRNSVTQLDVMVHELR